MVSVIVPIYNAEKYIERCVNSVISQTYTDWELFLIDDGSTDKSFEIIRDYANKDKRIKAIHKKNAGAGAARNTGLTYVSGDYVVFVDSDDYIEKDYFELLSKHNEDVIFIDVNRRNTNGSNTIIERLSVLDGKNKDDILRMQMTGKILWGGVRKAVRRNLIEKEKIRYSCHKVGEEAIYSFLVLYYAENFSFINEPVYNYEVHPDSLSQSYNVDPWGAVALELREKVKKLGCYESYADTLNCFIVTALIVALKNIAIGKTFKEYKLLANKKIDDVMKLLDSNYRIDIKHMNIKAKILLPFVNRRMLRVVYLASKMR